MGKGHLPVFPEFLFLISAGQRKCNSAEGSRSLSGCTVTEGT